MGVRISWLMLARNSLFARSAASARSRAYCRAFSALRWTPLNVNANPNVQNTSPSSPEPCRNNIALGVSSLGYSPPNARVIQNAAMATALATVQKMPQRTLHNRNANTGTVANHQVEGEPWPPLRHANAVYVHQHTAVTITPQPLGDWVCRNSINVPTRPTPAANTMAAQCGEPIVK